MFPVYLPKAWIKVLYGANYHWHKSEREWVLGPYRKSKLFKFYECFLICKIGIIKFTLKYGYEGKIQYM